MVLFVVTVTLAVLLTSAANAAQPAHPCMMDNKYCTSRFSGYEFKKPEIINFTTQLLDQSFNFLLLSTTFNQHHKNRPGFEKLYRNVADRAWADTIALMKYQSKRGYLPELNPNYKKENSALRLLGDPQFADEHISLMNAMEYEKMVAELAHDIHKKSSVAATHQSKVKYDPDVAHFFDETIISGRSDSVRKLTGYIHMLDGILNADDYTRDMGLHLFDQHLKTVE